MVRISFRNIKKKVTKMEKSTKFITDVAIIALAIIIVLFLFAFILQALSSILIPVAVIVLAYIIIKWLSKRL